MAILHGSWLKESHCLFVWGETWRSQGNQSNTTVVDGVRVHPLAMTPEELADWLQNTDSLPQAFRSLLKRLPSVVTTPPERSRKRGVQSTNTTTKQTQNAQIETLSTILVLPSSTDDTTYPIHSVALPQEYVLQPWRVNGLYLEPIEALKFLTALPLGTTNREDEYLGGDLRFWSHIARWSLDLLSRCKFLPTLQKIDDLFVANWRSLLDSAVDTSRLEKFAKVMPSVCLNYRGEERGARSEERGARGEKNNYLDLPSLSPQELLLSFLDNTIDAQVRAIVGSSTIPTTQPPIHEWLQALVAQNKTIAAAPNQLERLEAILNAWVAPLQYQLNQSQFRTCFVLHPPESGVDWKLAYGLQAASDANFLIDAAEIWNHPVEVWEIGDRTIAQPQETFLQGLGLASRLFAPIATSLEQPYPTACRLTPFEAYEFIKSIAPRFTDSGLGVVLPPSLANREGWANRLGLKIKAVTPRKKSERLGLQSLLNFEWELAIGGQTLSKTEFDRLVAKNSPIVEINGEWVELRSQDIQTAQTFFASRKEKLSLSLEDALRLSTGDSLVIEKLPVVNFEATGALQELMSALTNNQAIASLPTPESFQGELRPYQQRGFSWLAFLERWGLGACLADDMGLGKCLSKDSRLYVNGELRTAEDIWQTHRAETTFDGEGFWTNPTAQLLVNSIDQITGKIVQAPIRRLYRQHVREKLRKVTLQDGSSITITRRHQLLTSKGWKNELYAGDYVCVPAKMVWQGQPEDADLVKFLAWQIAEGYEDSAWGKLAITQKDPQCLEKLLLILQRLSQRYNIKINNPRIYTFSGKTPALQISSKAYQRFLEAKGYAWGKRSAQKAIPPFIMQADLYAVQIFLQNYFDAEAAVISSMRSIEISTASALLIEQLSTLLRRFGIWLHIVSKQKRATNGSSIRRTYYIGTIGGNSARRFLQDIGFSNPQKQSKLAEICQDNNTNVEGIPASEVVAEIVQTTQLPIRHFGMHNTVYINGSQQFSRNSLQQVIAGCDRILSGEAEQAYRQQKTSKWTAQTLSAYTALDRQQLNSTKESLQQLLAQEVFYCKIASIEDVEYEDWVYDFEVSDRHNFVANNIICHNTIQFIAFMLHQKEQKALENPTLLVCPTSVLGNWEREIKKFGPQLKVLLHHGDKRPKGKAFTQAVQKHDLVITSYALIHRDVKDLQSISWQGVVLDEAQNIKNSEAKQSQAARQLESAFRIALTGTPVENRLQELWSILDFLNPGYLGTRQFFQRRFAMPIEKYGDSDSLMQLRSLVQPFILRRVKTDRDIIQDLPEKQEITEFCGISTEQAALYQQVVEASLAEIDSAEGLQRRGMILALLVKLKQICNHPAQFLKQNKIAEPRSSGKLLRLGEMLEEALAGGDRALIFTQFAEWGKLLQPYLQQHLQREILFLYGSTSKKQREEMIDRFQHDPQAPPIMILSLKAGGVGLNLTRANHVFHFDRWWNPAVENQATDRAFRIGQTRNVLVHKFVCTGTLEEKIHEMIEGKKALAEQVVGAGEQWLTELDTNQLRNLLILDRNAVIDEDA